MFDFQVREDAIIAQKILGSEINALAPAARTPLGSQPCEELISSPSAPVGDCCGIFAHRARDDMNRRYVIASGAAPGLRLRNGGGKDRQAVRFVVIVSQCLQAANVSFVPDRVR
jgi:hypothetical protein